MVCAVSEYMEKPGIAGGETEDLDPELIVNPVQVKTEVLSQSSLLCG